MHSVTDRIPAEKFQIFHEILKSTGGYYLSNPLDYGDYIRVHYEPGTKTSEAWYQATTSIVETYKNQWWRIVGRKILGVLHFYQKRLS